MPNYKLIATDLWNRFGKAGKILTIVAGIIGAYSVVQPAVSETLDEAYRVWTTQERIDKVQSELDTIQNQKLFNKQIKMEKDLKTLSGKVNYLEIISEDQQEYILVLNRIVDGVLVTHYHRGIRYGRTRMGDTYYHAEDCDHIKKWMRAIYSAEKDRYGFINHNGEYKKIIPIEKSKILP